MRILVIGAGAVGGVVGARLLQAGHDVTLVARGRHLGAIRDAGLRLSTPTGRTVLRPAAAAAVTPALAEGADAALVACKSQHTTTVVDQLAAVAPAHLPLVSLQNGVGNEPAMLRRFDHVYGVAVMCPAGFFVPGHVIAYASPVTGILDVGRYPDGSDQTATHLSDAFAGATFVSEPRADVMRWKYRKLVVNTGNAIEALAGPAARAGPAGDLVTKEAERVLDAAGIDRVSVDEDVRRRGDLVRRAPVDGLGRPGGSMWQSLARGTGSIEADHINGEIVRIAQRAGTVAPINDWLRRRCTRLATERHPPGAMDPGALLETLRALAAGGNTD